MTYEVTFDKPSKNAPLQREHSRYFETKRAAIKWAKWVASNNFCRVAQVWDNGANLVFEKQNPEFNS